MNCKEIITELRAQGNDRGATIMVKQGATNALGVKVEDLKKIVKRIGQNKQLSMELFATEIPDAQYLAGLISVPEAMSRDDLQLWVESSNYWMITEHPVAWATSESRFAIPTALDWLDSLEEKIASCGWASLSAYVGITDNRLIDFDLLTKLMQRVASDITTEQRNRVRYTMNGFIIAVGSYCSYMTDAAVQLGKSLGNLKIELAGAGCKVPFAPEYIEKAVARGTHEKKRKSPRC